MQNKLHDLSVISEESNIEASEPSIVAPIEEPPIPEDDPEKQEAETQVKVKKFQENILLKLSQIG